MGALLDTETQYLPGSWYWWVHRSRGSSRVHTCTSPHLPHLLPTAVPIVDSDDQRRAGLGAARRVEQSTLGLVIAAGAGYRRAPVLTNLHKEVDGLG